MSIHALRVMTISIGLALSGCSGAGGSQERRKTPDLTEQFQPTTTHGLPSDRRDKNFSRHYPVTRKGRRRDSMVLVAPVMVRAALRSIQAGSYALVCFATPVFNIGDGIQMDVLLASGGTERVIYQRYFDAARRVEDRDWIPLFIPLESNGAMDAELQIRVSGGPQGDLVDDWLALSEVQLVPRDTSR